MPVFLLCLKATLENIEKIEVPDDFCFDLTIKNSESDDTRDVILSAEESLPLSTGRGFAHFVMKWEKGSKSEATINIVEVKGVTRPLESEDSEAFVPIIGFECRGAEPVAFRPRSGFTVHTVSGNIIEDVDLTELDWCDFDDDKGVSVGIYGMESRFEVHRK